MKKRGMELSINILVVVILGIVLIGVGLMLIAKINDKLIDIHCDISSERMEELTKLHFTDGRLVGVLNPQQSVQRGKTGNCGNDGWFLLGIRNEGRDKDFLVYAEYNEGSPVHEQFELTDYYNDRDKYTGTAEGPKEMVIYPYSTANAPLPLKNNEKQFMWIAVSPPKDIPTGTYLWDVYVCVNATPDYAVSHPDKCNSPEADLGSYVIYTGQKQRLFIDVT